MRVAPAPPTCRRSRRPRRRATARCARGWSRSAQECRAEHPDWWNAPVPAFGDRDAWLAIVGLAPGKHGANRTGRPFTGDYAGELLYATLAQVRPGRGRISAPIRPTGCSSRARSSSTRSNACRRRTSPSRARSRPAAIISRRRSAHLPNVRVVVALGQIAHVAAARALGLPPSSTKFGHGAESDRARRPHPAVELSLLALQPEHAAGSMPRCSKACSSGRGFVRDFEDRSSVSRP